MPSERSPVRRSVGIPAPPSSVLLLLLLLLSTACCPSGGLGGPIVVEAANSASIRNTNVNETSVIEFRVGGTWGPTICPQSFFQASIWAGFVAEAFPDNGIADLLTGRFRHPSRKFLMVPGGLVTAALVSRVDLMMKIMMIRLAASPPHLHYHGDDGVVGGNGTSTGSSAVGLTGSTVTSVATPSPPGAPHKVELTPNFLFFITQTPIVYFLLKAGGAMRIDDHHTSVIISSVAIYSNFGSLLVLALGQLLIKLVVSAITGRRVMTNNLTSPFLHVLSIFVVPMAMHGAYYFTQEELLTLSEKPTTHTILVGVVVGLYVCIFLGTMISNGRPAPSDSWRQVLSFWYDNMCPTPKERIHYAWILSCYLFSAAIGMVGGNWIGALFDGEPYNSPMQDLFSYGMMCLFILSSISNLAAVILLPDVRKLSVPALLSDVVMAIASFPQLSGNVTGPLLGSVLWLWGIRAVIVHLIQPMVDTRTLVPAPAQFQQTLRSLGHTLDENGNIQDSSDSDDDDGDQTQGSLADAAAQLNPSEALERRTRARTGGSFARIPSDRSSSGVGTSEDPFDTVGVVDDEGSEEHSVRSGHVGEEMTPRTKTKTFGGPPTVPKVPTLASDPLPPLPSRSTRVGSSSPEYHNSPAPRSPAPVSAASASPEPLQLPPAWVRHLPDPKEGVAAQKHRSSILRRPEEPSPVTTAQSYGGGGYATPLLSPRSSRSSTPANTPLGTPVSTPVAVHTREGSNGSFVLSGSFSEVGGTRPKKNVSFTRTTLLEAKEGAPRRRGKPKPVVVEDGSASPYYTTPYASPPTGSPAGSAAASPSRPTPHRGSFTSPQLTRPTRFPTGDL